MGASKHRDVDAAPESGRGSGIDADEKLLDPRTVGEYLIRREIVPRGTVVNAWVLGGGVSNVVLAVDAPGLRVVVKQALPKLRVESDWQATRRRTATEAQALELVRGVTPLYVPRVLDSDPGLCAMVIERAPDTWNMWKSDLLEGRFDDSVAARLGSILAGWHLATLDNRSVESCFDDYEAFRQLRVRPYHEHVAVSHPEVADAIHSVVDIMEMQRRCLVHGDYSPKNVLVEGARMWVVDFEVAHFGDPMFDVAFLLNHLLLKGVHLNRSISAERCSEAFLHAYRKTAPSALAWDERCLSMHVGCLLLARVDGKSPAEYLSLSERSYVRGVALSILRDPPTSASLLWRRVTSGQVRG
jgi:tRNA A-37 threonylcarbamoyl transferase component Bud32